MRSRFGLGFGLNIGRRPVLESEQVITLGDAHIATKDGEAMFFHDSIDFSAYAGTDAGFTPYYIQFEDSAGLIAAAYAGAAGGGEALGSELTVNGDMEDIDGGSVPDPPVGYSTNDNVTWESDNTDPHSGTLCGKLTSTGSTLRTVYQEIAADVGSLYKIVNWGRAQAGETLNCQPRDYITNIVSFVITSTSWVSKTWHRTMLNTSFRHWFYVSSETGSGWIDDLSFKKYTDIPATGLHLLSTKNGTTRNMATLPTGFDPNRINEIRVWRV